MIIDYFLICKRAMRRNITIHNQRDTSVAIEGPKGVLPSSVKNILIYNIVVGLFICSFPAFFSFLYSFL